MSKRKHWYLLAYDIRQPKRLRKLHYFLSKHALALQNSVFMIEADQPTLQTLLNGVKKRVHQQEDDLRLYPLTHPNQIWAAGQQSIKLTGLYSAAREREAFVSKGLISRLFGLTKGNGNLRK